jgi:putative redox protein
MEASIIWERDLLFSARVTGFEFNFHSPVESETTLGPSPMEALLTAVAACTAMDVISILIKKRQKVTGYRVEVAGDRPEPGTWPRPFTRITVKHIIEGESIDPDAVARAVELSDGKYCSVSATLRTAPEIHNTWQINSPQSSANT